MVILWALNVMDGDKFIDFKVFSSLCTILIKLQDVESLLAFYCDNWLVVELLINLLMSSLVITQLANTLYVLKKIS